MTDLDALAQQFNVTNQPAKTGHMVTVAQLREALADLPGDAFVVLQKDGEGNGYSPLAVDSHRKPGVYPVWYVPESTWQGQVYDLQDAETLDGEEFEPSAGDLFAVVLTPVN